MLVGMRVGMLLRGDNSDSSGFGFRNLTTWFKSWFYHILVVWPQGSCLTSLSLFFFFSPEPFSLSS